MNKFLSLCMVLALTTMFATEVIAQERGKGNRPSPNATVTQDIGRTTVSITYGRPGLKERDVNTLVNDAQNGIVWRTGANEATTITFSTDVQIGGKDVKAGTYTMFSLPGDSWIFIFNKKLLRDDRPAALWGTQYDESQDLVRVPAAVTKTNAPVTERFMIFFDELSNTKAHLNLHWGSILVAVPITITPSE